jgi:hypothetical protein
MSAAKLWILVIMSLASSGCIQADRVGNKGPAKERLDGLARELQEGGVGTIEIVQISPDKMYLIRVTPEAMETVWDYRFKIQNIDSSRRAKLVDALKASDVQQIAEVPDLRYEVVFYATDEHRISALYFDRSGNRGLVDNFAVSFGRDFFPMLRHALRLSFE